MAGRLRSPPRQKSHMPTQRPVFRVLVIDDDVDDQFLVGRALEKLEPRPQVRFMLSATHAVAHLDSLERASTETPYLIICDIKMPRMDGFEFLQWLRKSRHRAIPVVMRSNSNIHRDVERAYLAGANSFVSKVSDPEEMPQKLSDIVHYWRDVSIVPVN